VKAIDIEEVKRTFCYGAECTKPYCMDDPNYEGMICAELDAFLKAFEQNEIIEAIPVSYILCRIRDTSGAESAYLSRLIRRYREEHGSNALS
jgi:hypothetical protein